MKKLTYKHIIIYTGLIVILGFNRAAVAQEVIEISMVEAITLARENSWEVAKQKSQNSIAKAELYKTSSVFLPSVKLFSSYFTTNDPLQAFGFKLKQRETKAQDFDTRVLNNPDLTTNFNTRVEIQQPIFNYDAIYARKAAEKNVKGSKAQLEWTKSMAVLKARDLYFQLILAQRKVNIYQSFLETARQIAGVVEDNFDEGLVQRSDLMSAQLKITEMESKLIGSQNQLIYINDELAHHLNLEIGSRINPTDEITALHPDHELMSMDHISPDRNDLLARRQQLEAHDQLLKSSNGNFIPRLNALAIYEWNDPKLFGFQADMYLVGARLEWDIFSGGKKIGNRQEIKALKAKSALELDEKISLANKELAGVKNQLLLVKKQLHLSEQGIAQAEEAYKIQKDRFDQGLVQTSELLKASDILLEKKMELLAYQSAQNILVIKLDMLLEGTQN